MDRGCTRETRAETLPIWSDSTLKKSVREAGHWTDVKADAQYDPCRLHATYESLGAFIHEATQEQRDVISNVVKACDDVYTLVHDAIIAGDPKMADVTNTLIKTEFSTLTSRCIPTADVRKDGTGRKKYCPWKEPADGTNVKCASGQPGHMDMKDGAGGSILVAVERQASIDIFPDSADGIELLYSDLLPIYAKAMEYYQREIHPSWLAWNPEEGMECGKATFWSYIVDRHFQRCGVKRQWERITLTLQPGHGVFVSNRMLHAGSKHRGQATYRIHMYMAEQGLLAADLSQPENSEIVYDYRTDPQLFVLARYLNVKPCAVINMTPAV
jgi:hypothetical protein